MTTIEENAPRVHPYDLAMARVRRQLSRQLAVCGGWKNAGQKERETPTGRPAASILHVSSPLVHATSLDKGHAI